MTDVTTEFFSSLQQNRREPLLEDTHGTVRFDLRDGVRTSHWFLTIEKGRVTVTRGKGAADCVVGAETALFERFVTGDANVMAAFLRGAVTVEGELSLVLVLERVITRGMPVATAASQGSAES